VIGLWVVSPGTGPIGLEAAAASELWWTVPALSDVSHFLGVEDPVLATFFLGDRTDNAIQPRRPANRRQEGMQRSHPLTRSSTT
jgi:hypothetical protein